VQLTNTLGIAIGTGMGGAIVAISTLPLGLAAAIAMADLVMALACGAARALAGRVPAQAPSATGAARLEVRAERGPVL
jgi:hypothetical protein